MNSFKKMLEEVQEGNLFFLLKHDPLEISIDRNKQSLFGVLYLYNLGVNFLLVGIIVILKGPIHLGLIDSICINLGPFLTIYYGFVRPHSKNLIIDLEQGESEKKRKINLFYKVAGGGVLFAILSFVVVYILYRSRS